MIRISVEYNISIEILENFTPKQLYLFLKESNKIKNIEIEEKINLQIINAYYTWLFHGRKKVDLNKYLIKENTKKTQVKKQMTKEEMLDQLKKCHIAFGGKISDFQK